MGNSKAESPKCDLYHSDLYVSTNNPHPVGKREVTMAPSTREEGRQVTEELLGACSLSRLDSPEDQERPNWSSQEAKTKVWFWL